MKSIITIAKRELTGYFASPVAFVFIVIFLILSGFFSFMVGGFFERGQASLESFFAWHPWLYLFLVPAVGMRMWSEERRLGTIELLLTMPVTPWQAIVGKFIASWAVVALALVLTFPMWITVNYLGNPDNGVILAGYVGSFLMGGAYLVSNMGMAALMLAPAVFAFGLVASPLALLTPFAVMFIGFAFGAAGFALTTHLRSWKDFDFIFIILTPLFLFSATFYPVEIYPGALRYVVELSPLTRGTHLIRSLCFGDLNLLMLADIGFLALIGVLGYRHAVSRLGKLLLK